MGRELFECDLREGPGAKAPAWSEGGVDGSSPEWVAGSAGIPCRVDPDQMTERPQQALPEGKWHPGHVSLPSAEPRDLLACKEEVVLASHILLRRGVVDAFGHVSIRHPEDPDRFLMARRVPPGLVTADDVLPFGLDGELVDQDGTPVFLERFIHSAIYARRPDVQAVVHSHSHNIIAFGIVPSVQLQPVCHMCGFLSEGVPVFEIRDVAGDATNLLISTPGLGEALAENLGQANVVLMRGHGSTVVGGTLPQAVYRAIYTETNARIQATAASLGPVTFLSPGEARAVADGEALQIERAWQLWKEEAGS